MEHFSQALTNCKVSEKSNERFSTNSVTDYVHTRMYRRTYGLRMDVRTDGRTDGRESLGVLQLRRETKKSVNLMRGSRKKLTLGKFLNTTFI